MSTLLPLEAPHLALPATALARSVSTFGGSDFDDDGVVQIDRFCFTSLDEPMLIEMRLQQRRQDQQRDRWIGRAIGAGVGLCVGIGSDGFDLGDLSSAFMGGVVGDLAADGLNQLSDQELKDLRLEWAVGTDSLDFHMRRHGRPRQRMLVLAAASDEQLFSSCAARFEDGYLAFFSTEPFCCELHLFHGRRRLSSVGVMPEPSADGPLTVAMLPCSDGRQRPLQRLETDQGPVLAMALNTPHHSLY